MRIKSFEIYDLFGSNQPIYGSLANDLNIITGRNGAGKTTVLKLIWYVISGNINIAIREIDFSRVVIKTTVYECTLRRINRVTCEVDILHNGKLFEYRDEDAEDGGFTEDAEEMANVHLRELGSSLFLPTFRRIEGGFTLGQKRRPINPRNALAARGVRSDIEDGLTALSRNLTNEQHVFVASISTIDVVTLLLQQYADMSELSNDLQKKTSQDVIDRILAYKMTDGAVVAEDVIDDILHKIESVDSERESIMAPFVAMTSLVSRLFKHAGIQIGDRLSIGDAASAINSDALSAGEKQMLSFISYNAFHKGTIIFVDEPELSLHVDWQRQLFPILESQQSGNQFIIATHSPFIYSKYPDKEIMISRDRGDEVDV